MPHKSSPTIAITGAGGLVGRALVEHFTGLGWHIRALVRHPAGQPARPGVAYMSYDMTAAELDPALLSGVDYLVHAAYIKDDAQHPEALKQNIAAARSLFALGRRSGVKHTVFLSTMSAHSGAVSGYAAQKQAIEKLCNTKQDTVLRCGLVIGDGGLIKNIIGFMRSKHVAPYIGQGEQPLQVIAAYDVARVIEKVCTQRMYGKMYVAHPDIYSYREFYRMLIDELGLKAITVAVPFWLPLMAIRMINTLHLPLRVTEDNLQGLKHLRAFDTSADLRRLDLEVDNLYQILHNPSIRSKLL